MPALTHLLSIWLHPICCQFDLIPSPSPACNTTSSSNSSQPSLHALCPPQGFDLVPVTLEVGDFVLSPTMAVERKAVPDLLQSLASGRCGQQPCWQSCQHPCEFVLSPTMAAERKEQGLLQLLPGAHGCAAVLLFHGLLLTLLLLGLNYWTADALRKKPGGAWRAPCPTCTSCAQLQQSCQAHRVHGT